MHDGEVRPEEARARRTPACKKVHDRLKSGLLFLFFFLDCISGIDGGVGAETPCCPSMLSPSAPVLSTCTRSCTNTPLCLITLACIYVGQ